MQNGVIEEESPKLKELEGQSAGLLRISSKAVKIFESRARG